MGFAMYYFTYDPWVGKQLYLEEFYVMDEYRGKTTPVLIYILNASQLLPALKPHFPLSRDGHRLRYPAAPQ